MIRCILILSGFLPLCVYAVMKMLFMWELLTRFVVIVFILRWTFFIYKSILCTSWYLKLYLLGNHPVSLTTVPSLVKTEDTRRADSDHWVNVLRNLSQFISKGS